MAHASEILSALGKRVTIRLHLESGGYSDIVGVLQDSKTLIDRDGREITFNQDEIAVWREIIPLKDRAGSGAPQSIRIAELEELSNITWPAQRIVPLGGWLLRISEGDSLRANSVLPFGSAPIGAPDRDFDEALAEVVEHYRKSGLDAVFSIALPTYSELDNLLDERGWKTHLTGSFMVQDLKPIEVALPNNMKFELSSSLDALWLEVQHQKDQKMQMLMQGYPAQYGSIMINQQRVAVGRIAIHGSWSIVTRFFVESLYRKMGIGTNLMRLLMNSAIDSGASKIAIQVDSANEAAISLYSSLGFRFHHEYRYKVMGRNFQESLKRGQCC